MKVTSGTFVSRVVLAELCRRGQLLAADSQPVVAPELGPSGADHAATLEVDQQEPAVMPSLAQPLVTRNALQSHHHDEALAAGGTDPLAGSTALSTAHEMDHAATASEAHPQPLPDARRYYVQRTMLEKLATTAAAALSSNPEYQQEVQCGLVTHQTRRGQVEFQEVKVTFNITHHDDFSNEEYELLKGRKFLRCNGCSKVMYGKKHAERHTCVESPSLRRRGRKRARAPPVQLPGGLLIATVAQEVSMFDGHTMPCVRVTLV